MWRRICWLLLVLLVGCGRDPGTLPSDFAVQVGIDGGMLPYSRNVSLRVGAGEDVTFINGVRLAVQFQPTPADLGRVYQAVIENQFDRIKVDEEEVYDRGGTSVGVNLEGEFIWVYDSGMSFVRERWQDEYQAVYAAAFQLVTAQPDAAAGSFTLTWDDQLAFGGWEILLTMGGDYLGMSDTDSVTQQVEIYTRQASASYPITLSNSVNGNTATFILDMSQYRQVFLTQEGGEPMMIGE